MLNDILSWGFLILIVLIAGAVYFWDNFKCKHEWKEHKFLKGGATKYYLICKKCGKVKILK